MKSGTDFQNWQGKELLKTFFKGMTPNFTIIFFSKNTHDPKLATKKFYCMVLLPPMQADDGLATSTCNLFCFFYTAQFQIWIFARFHKVVAQRASSYRSMCLSPFWASRQGTASGLCASAAAGWLNPPLPSCERHPPAGAREEREGANREPSSYSGSGWHSISHRQVMHHWGTGRDTGLPCGWYLGRAAPCSMLATQLGTTLGTFPQEPGVFRPALRVCNVSSGNNIDLWEATQLVA